MPRVAGCDPGTSSLDIIILDDGQVADEVRFSAEKLAQRPGDPVTWLNDHGPFDLIAGPSGYGLPLVRREDCDDFARELMILRRDDEHGLERGVSGFSALLRELCRSNLPVVFLPGVIHLKTVPTHRKLNRIDLGTPDKLCVAAMAVDRWVARTGSPVRDAQMAVVELGSAFTAIMVINQGKIVDGLGGSSGPLGWRSPGAWDGELAYLVSPMQKEDLFAGGAAQVAKRSTREQAFRESLVKAVASLRTVTPFTQIVLSGALLKSERELCELVSRDLRQIGEVSELESLPGAGVKTAAQGAALIADGLTGGSRTWLVKSLDLAGANGTCLDHIVLPRWFEISRIRLPLFWKDTETER